MHIDNTTLGFDVTASSKQAHWNVELFTDDFPRSVSCVCDAASFPGESKAGAISERKSMTFAPEFCRDPCAEATEVNDVNLEQSKDSNNIFGHASVLNNFLQSLRIIDSGDNHHLVVFCQNLCSSRLFVSNGQNGRGIENDHWACVCSLDTCSRRSAISS